MLFIEYPKCSICQKARKWLEAQGLAFTTRHIREDAPTADKLKDWHMLILYPSNGPFNSFL